MTRLWRTIRSATFALVILALCNVSGVGVRFANAQSSATSKSTSWTESVSTGVKNGFSKVGSIFSPKKPAASKLEDDELSLYGKGKPDANLYVAVARLYEKGNKTGDAEIQYQKALQEDPNHLSALLGYAQLQDRLGRSEEAIRLYQRAAQAHPKEAAVFNNIGLCYARYGRASEAVPAIARAVQLEPRNTLYRNNLATVLVDQGKVEEAVGQLRRVHPEAIAQYNVGYLLTKKDQPQAALQHFTLALQADPSLGPAQRWVEYLEKKTAQARLPKPMDAGAKVVAHPHTPAAPPTVQQPPLEEALMPHQLAPLPPNAPLTRRLPPVNAREPAAVITSYSLSAAQPKADAAQAVQVTPLPPVTASRPSIDPVGGLR